MLFKKIISLYGRSLSAAAIPPESDIIHCMTPASARRKFRQAALDDISGAKHYLLDAEAANYADSFSESVRGEFTEAGFRTITSFMEEIEFPSELTWVEYDHRLLVADRFRRGHVPDPDYQDPREFGLRGFLFDDRDAGFLKITLFRTDGREKLIDPLSHIEFKKEVGGNAKLHAFRMGFHEHMLHFYRAARASELDIKEIVEQERNECSYDMALGFVLFALLNSPSNGILMEEMETLTRAEQKQARKFGKTWLSEALRSHVTIRIGPEAKAHLSEQAARREHERSARLSPAKHWVSEHERCYKSGKIVKIQAYERGIDVDKSIPTRVMGPRSR